MNPLLSFRSSARRTPLLRATLLALAFAALSLPASAMSDDEAAIAQLAQAMQDGWNRKDGQAFAAPFADGHDYVNIHGMFIPDASREGNARAHQGLFASVYKDTDLSLRVTKVRFLSPQIAVAHFQGHTHPKGNADEKRQEIVITGVMQKRAGQWEIVAFQNTQVKRPSP